MTHLCQGCNSEFIMQPETQSCCGKNAVTQEVICMCLIVALYTLDYRLLYFT